MKRSLMLGIALALVPCVEALGANAPTAIVDSNYVRRRNSKTSKREGVPVYEYWRSDHKGKGEKKRAASARKSQGWA